MVDMGKKIKKAAPCLWELLGVLLDANLTRRRAAPKLKKTYVEEDLEMEMDLGAMGSSKSETCQIQLVLQ
jgi:hypothetical protein